MTIASSFEQVTNNSPDGAQVGKGTGEKVAFYGSTPVVQPTSASQGTVTITAANPASPTAAASALTASATEAVSLVAPVVTWSSNTPTAGDGAITISDGASVTGSEVGLWIQEAFLSFTQTNTDLDDHKVAIDQNVVDVADQKEEIDKLVTDYAAGRAEIVKLVTDVTATNVLVNQLRSELVTLGLIKGS